MHLHSWFDFLEWTGDLVKIFALPCKECTKDETRRSFASPPLQVFALKQTDRIVQNFYSDVFAKLSKIVDSSNTFCQKHPFAWKLLLELFCHAWPTDWSFRLASATLSSASRTKQHMYEWLAANWTNRNRHSV